MFSFLLELFATTLIETELQYLVIGFGEFLCVEYPLKDIQVAKVCTIVSVFGWAISCHYFLFSANIKNRILAVPLLLSE